MRLPGVGEVLVHHWPILTRIFDCCQQSLTSILLIDIGMFPAVSRAIILEVSNGCFKGFDQFLLMLTGTLYPP